jgi:5-methylcytosine-specific restriction endonuclease McrA
MRTDRESRLARRKRLLEEYGNVCRYCGCAIKENPQQMDHIIPISLGGEEYDDNVVLVCGNCNKSNRVVFSCLTDREIYPIIDIELFFR